MPAWKDLEREVLDGIFRFSPGWGRSVGDHRYDGVLGDPSSTTVTARTHELTSQIERLERSTGLSPDDDVDRRSLLAQLRAALFDLTELKSPWTDPLAYTGGASELDVSAYIKRSYAPLPERLHSLRRHLAGYSGYLEAARSNLSAALPRPHLTTAIEAAEGQIEYLAGEVRSVAAGDLDTLEAIEGAAAELAAFVDFLKSRLPAAHDGFALGPARFCRLLLTRELVDFNVEQLERMARSDLARNSARLADVAAEIVPSGTIQDALLELQRHHPTVKSIIDETTGMLEGLRSFIVERDLMSVPSEVRCQVRPTPAFYAYISAALDSAGPLETVATESYYYVTVPTPEWGASRTEEWLRYLNYSMLENISIHEAYPGHYLQSLHERRAASLSRRLLWVQSTGEGWAHYVEELMVEVGYRPDPRLEMAQLLDALLRDCRFLVAIGLHCQGMSMREAIELFMQAGLQSELPATREAQRGAWDPLYLNYTLGKLLIQELKRRHRARPDFNLKTFHDAFLRCGNLPIPLVAELIQ